MLKNLPILISLAITLYAFFDVVRRQNEEVRRLPRWAWIVLVILFGGIGGLLYLLLGRPKQTNTRPKRGKPRIIPPDDDPDFLNKL